MCLRDLAGGGAEAVAVTLANEMRDMGYDIHVVLVQREGPNLSRLSPDIPVHVLGGRTALAALALSQWIAQNRPDVLISHLTHMNVAALIATRLAGGATRTMLVEHNQMDANFRKTSSLSVRLAYVTARFLYPLASHVVCVSSGVATSVVKFARLSGENIRVVSNAVVQTDFRSRASEPPPHAWLRERPAPIFSACGRLVEQKGFDTLLEAFALVRASRDTRLIILGDGPLKEPLQEQARSLGIEASVDFVGFHANALSFMSHADVFVLSSNWEGMPTVLIEALALGLPIVATDCHSGPRELLDDGALGILTPVGDAEALARGMLLSLSSSNLAAAQRARVAPYHARAAATAYLNLIFGESVHA